MTRQIDAILEPDGTVRILESIQSDRPRRAVLTVFDEEVAATVSPLASEDVELEEVLRGQPRPKGATLQDLMPVYGSLDRGAAEEMQRIIDGEFGHVESEN